MIATKHPKSRHYAGSESLGVRVSAGVAQKNEGTTYIVEVNKELQLSPGDETLKNRSQVDRKRARRAEKQTTKTFKSQRLFLKRKSSSKSARQEEKEGITYSTDCGLLDGFAELVDDPSGL